MVEHFSCSVPFVWRIHAYPSDYWRFTKEGVKLLFPRIRFSALMYGHDKLSEDAAAPSKMEHETVYFQRSEVYGFGVRI